MAALRSLTRRAFARGAPALSMATRPRWPPSLSALSAAFQPSFRALSVSRRQSRQQGRVTSEYENRSFRKDAEGLLDTVEKGLEDIMDKNKEFMLVRSPGRLDITTDAATEAGYSLVVDEGNEVLNFMSPVSGGFQYKLNADGKWLCTLDQHDFIGLLTRDMLRHAAGVAKF